MANTIKGKQVQAASTGNSGVLTAAAQTLFGKKTFDSVDGISEFVEALKNNVGTSRTFISTATPEAQITGSPGDFTVDVLNGTLYIKRTGGNTNTGWVMLATATAFIGATSTLDGAQGLVPTPLVNQQDFLIYGDGVWAPTQTLNHKTSGNNSSSGPIGNAASTVDQASYINIQQSTPGVVLTLPNPTNTARNRRILVYNSGSSMFTMYGFTVQPGATLEMVWEGSRYYVSASFHGDGLCSPGTVKNGLMSVTAASATATFSADEIVVGNTLGGITYRVYSYSQAINLATTGPGGMDTGVAPVNGFVALYAIYNPTTGVKSILATNATTVAPTNVYSGANLPAGFTVSGLISIWPTDAASLLKIGYQRNRSVFTQPTTLLNTTTQAAAMTSFSIAAGVPPGAVYWTAEATITGVNTANPILAVSGSNTSVGRSRVQGNVAGLGSANGAGGTVGPVPVITSQTAFYQTANAAGGTFLINLAMYEF